MKNGCSTAGPKSRSTSRHPSSRRMSRAPAMFNATDAGPDPVKYGKPTLVYVLVLVTSV